MSKALTRKGPALGLTEQQSQFVYWYGQIGKVNKAAHAAGISRRHAHTLLRKAKIQAALQQEIVKQLGEAAAIGWAGILELAQSAESDKVRLDACRFLLERALGKTPDRVDHRHMVDNTATEDELKAEIADLWKEVGGDPEAIEATFDVVPSEIEDAVVEEVDKDDEWEIIPLDEVSDE